ncbi:MAG: hypothetical protein LCH38_02995 [Proteobacteria bacterium]|nr:hypothetical protein [Pseudomonadota bacterium]
MNWEFLKKNRDTRGRDDAIDLVSPEEQKQLPADVRMLRLLDPRALGVAAETVRVNLDDFEATLAEVGRLPERFRLVMNPIENALKSMALLRNRVEVLESGLAAEQRKAAALATDLGRIKADAERQAFSLKSEESNTVSLREQLAASEANLSAIRQENADLSARLGRVEPLLRETVVAKEALEAEFEHLRKAKVQVEDDVVTLKAELIATVDKLADHENLSATLQATNQKQMDRIEETAKMVADLEASLKSTTDKLSFASAALVRERNAARNLRAENEQLTKEREESQLAYESKIDASRARYEFVERTLQEVRSRFHEETRQLSVARRERAERDREIGRLTLALESAQREASDLRGQVSAASEQSASSSTLLAAEVESRRKVELELDLLRSENSSLSLKLRSVNDSVQNIETGIADTTAKLQNRISELLAENEQLRSALSVARKTQDTEYDKEFEFLFAQDEETNVVTLR